MSDEMFFARALSEWLRPRQNLRWLVLGEMPHDALKFFAEQTAASEIVWAHANAPAAENALGDVPLRAGDLHELARAAKLHDATLLWNALDVASDVNAFMALISRVTRLYGIVAAVSRDLDKRALWDVWLDARLNDVSTRALPDNSGWMVRGTR